MGPVGLPFGGRVFIADTSAWARSERDAVAADWRRAITSGQIATCPIVTMELLYSAHDAVDFGERERLLAKLYDVPINRPVTDAGLAAMRALARRPLHHRLPLSDVLIAAAAQEFELGVLHYDHHYDRLAEVMSFESRWIAPPGSLDR